ncbi:TetR/AcrR family transcriptional regulator [Gellertiella hungarica]|nr:TetR/AcrR family transcriptional regulator [Gellertiella hungarica]
MSSPVPGAVTVCAEPAGVGRRAAGEDPRKRDQILEGAKRVFMKAGFDAATMNDITREAQVSKGTIYVYFNNKEDLFAALIERERSRLVASMRSALSGDGSIEENLTSFGTALATHVLSPGTIYAMRTVIGVIERMPQLANRFFTTGPDSVRSVIETYLASQVEAGHVELDDVPLAAIQFMELSTAGLFKPRLFGKLDKAVPREEIDRTVASAVRMFLATYGKQRG